MDAALSGLVLMWVTVGAGMALFHVYTVGLMALILYLGLSRGFWVAISRVAAISLILLGVAVWKGQPHTGHAADIGAMMACAGLSGFLGDRERKSRERLKASFEQTLEALAHALEARDPYTEGHSRRTSQIAVAIALKMGLDQRERTAIEQAGVLHDLGKIGTPDEVLKKNGALTPQEKHLMEQHPVVGNKILKGVAFLEEAANLVRHHHEHYDGSGYPDRLAGSAIPLGARVLAVADAFDALTTDRPYRQASTSDEVIQELETETGRHFDPTVVEVLKRCVSELKVRGLPPDKAVVQNARDM